MPSNIPEDLSRLLSLPIKIRILSRPTFEMEAALDFLSAEDTYWETSKSATAPERLVEFAGRVCYMSFGHKQHRKSTKKYIDNLVVSEHFSVLEHASWTILVTGVSRSFSHQMVRHRVGFSFSQLSQQYHDESDAKFVPPVEIRRDTTQLIEWLKGISSLHESYKTQLKLLSSEIESSRERLRALRSAARSVLPNCIETKIVISANAQAFRHFLRVRGNVVGDHEMRAVSVELFKALRKEAPNLFADFTMVPIEGGGSAVVQRVVKS